MKNEQRLYQAMIWVRDLPGLRVTVLAENLVEAKEKLEAEHGVGTVFDLHNADDAKKPR